MENGVTSAQIKGKSPIDSCTSIQPWPNCHFYIPECKLSRLLHFENYICIVVERASVPNYIDNVSFSQPFIFFIYISLLILRKFWEEIRWWNLHVSSRLHELWTHQKLYRETPSYHLRIYQVKKKASNTQCRFPFLMLLKFHTSNFPTHPASAGGGWANRKHSHARSHGNSKVD